MSTSAFLTGFTLSLSLIVAIGAQNAFVLRQGLRREHVLPVVLFCALADALLVAIGVTGLAGVLGERPQLARALAGVGALFLAGYGLRALWRSRNGAALQAQASSAPGSSGAVLAQAAAFTLLNPHVYLDTVLLVGSVGAQHAPAQRAAFIGGAALASAAWFLALGFGARWLAPVFARPRAWQWLDGVIGVAMLALAWGLVQRVLGRG